MKIKLIFWCEVKKLSFNKRGSSYYKSLNFYVEKKRSQKFNLNGEQQLS